MNAEYIINRDLDGDYSNGSNFTIINPYNLLYQFQSKLVDYTKNSIVDIIDTSNFIFANDFKIIPQLLEDIEDADFEKEDHDKLKSECCLLILRGFLYNQICYKLNDDGIEYWRNGYYSLIDMTNFTDEDIQKYQEFKYLKYIYYKLSMHLDEIDEKKINEIYQKYTDSKRNIVKKFTSELIPNYKKYLDPKKVIKIVFEMTEKYQKYFYHYDLKKPYIINFFFHYLPIKLIDSPDKFYDKVFKEVYTCSSNWFFSNVNEENFVVPKEIIPVTKTKTLIEQKYYIIYKLLEYAKDHEQNELSVYDYILLFSLFTWKIDIDCQEARNLEEYYQKSINYEVNYKEGDFYFSNYLDFINNKVTKSKKPLKKSEIDKSMSEQKQKSKIQ